MDILSYNKTDNLHLFILDPLSVIIKLAILSNKPIGTKLRINDNIIYLQEPGPFQSVCRFILKNNKTDIHYLYNPIEIACKNYLSENSITQHPQITELFKCAQLGLLKLIETYRNCSVMCICLNYYYSLLSNHIDQTNNTTLFRTDNMTVFYTQEVLSKMTNIWSREKVSIVLNIITFLSSDTSAEINVKSLETIIDGIDTQVSRMFI